jgi:hypothetical protein
MGEGQLIAFKLIKRGSDEDLSMSQGAGDEKSCRVPSCNTAFGAAELTIVAKALNRKRGLITVGLHIHLISTK